jgi:oligopeptide transport system substrate-binding protein
MKKIIPLVLIVLVCTIAFLFKNKIFVTKVENSLSLAINNPVKSFDPVTAFDDDSLSVIGQSLDTLYQYHYLKRPYEVIPSLAQALPVISKKGRRYTIKIKKNTKYHNQTKFLKLKDNRVVTASDFELQFKRIAFLPLKSVGRSLFSGKIVGFDEFSNDVASSFEKMLSKKIKGITVLDEYTLQIDLVKPEPNLIYFLCMNFVTPVPRELIQKYNNDLSKVLVGTGAYYLSSYSNETYTFLKNKEYRDEIYPSSGDRYANTQNLLNSSTEKLPFINSVAFKVIKNENERWDLFLDNQLDVLNVPKKFLSKVSGELKAFEEFKKEKNIEVRYATTISSRWLGMNMQDPVLGKNLYLRKAIAHSIDFDKYIEVLTNNTNLKANSIYNPSIPGYDPSHQTNYKYDLKKAKNFLKSSGVKTEELIITYSTRGNQQIHYNEAEFIKSQLAQIGLKVKVEVLSFSEFIKKGRAGEIQFFTDQWIYDYPDAENVIQLLISKNVPGINKSGYMNPKVDLLYSRLAGTLNKDERFSIMKEIEKIVSDELPWVMLMYESSYILHSKHVKNFRKSFFIRNYIKYLKKN